MDSASCPFKAESSMEFFSPFTCFLWEINLDREVATKFSLSIVAAGEEKIVLGFFLFFS